MALHGGTNMVLAVVGHALQAALQSQQIRLADAGSQGIHNVLCDLDRTARNTLCLVGECDAYNAPVVRATTALQKTAFFQHVQRMAHRAGIHTRDCGKVIAKHGRFSREQHQNLGLYAGDVEFLFHVLRCQTLERRRCTYQYMSNIVVLMTRSKSASSVCLHARSTLMGH